MLSFFQSCTIEKRHFRPGYNIEWKHRVKIPQTMPQNEEKGPVEVGEVPIQAAKNPVTVKVADFIQVQENLNVTEEPMEVPNPDSLKKFDSNECVGLFFKNGQKLSIRIVRTTPNTIKYLNCDKNDRYVKSIYKSKILGVKDVNGEKVDLGVKQKNVQDEPRPKKRSRSLIFIFLTLLLIILGISIGLAVAEIGIFLIFTLLALISLIVGIILATIDKNKEGVNAGVALFIIGIILLVLTGLFFVFLFLMMLL